MTQEFVNYEQALALKELGFDEPCFATYNMDKKVSRNPSHNMEDLPIEGQPYYWNNSKIHKDTVTAPLYQQAFRWFRKKYNLFGCIDLHTSTPTHWYIRVDDIIKNDYLFHSEDDNLEFNTYEEAELACLVKLIEIVKFK
jgi:hypothetical protein